MTLSLLHEVVAPPARLQSASTSICVAERRALNGLSYRGRGPAGLVLLRRLQGHGRNRLQVSYGLVMTRLGPRTSAARGRRCDDATVGMHATARETACRRRGCSASTWRSWCSSWPYPCVRPRCTRTNTRRTRPGDEHTVALSSHRNRRLAPSQPERCRTGRPHAGLPTKAPTPSGQHGALLVVVVARAQHNDAALPRQVGDDIAVRGGKATAAREAARPRSTARHANAAMPWSRPTHGQTMAHHAARLGHLRESDTSEACGHCNRQRTRFVTPEE